MRNDPEPGSIYFGVVGSFRSADVGEKPVPDDMPGVRGVYVGGCVSRGICVLDRDARSPAKAHTHVHHSDPYFGWVCFQLPEDFADASQRLHQLAHFSAKTMQHCDPWRAAMKQLGQEIPPAYKKRRNDPRFKFS